MHHADEFGKPASGVVSANSALLSSRRSIGTPSAITLDGIAERESGITPPPPPFSMRALVIGLAVMFLVGLVVLGLLMRFGPWFMTVVGP